MRKDMPKKMRTIVAVLIGVILAGTGCVSNTKPIVSTTKPTGSQRNFEAIWQASRQVLTKYYFQLDRQDRREGIITTTPLTGKQPLEFWRGDATSAYSLAENTIQTIYRTATVRINRKGKSGAYQHAVEIQVDRSNRKTLQVTSTSEAYDLFVLSGHTRSRGKFLLNYGADAGKSISPLGTDAQLERKIQAEIAATASKLLAKMN